MQDSKETKWASDIGDEPSAEDQVQEKEFNAGQEAANEPDGWQQYRRWISKAPVPRGRRSGVDPSIYTWKGYRNWSEQIKRNWSDS